MSVSRRAVLGWAGAGAALAGTGAAAGIAVDRLTQPEPAPAGATVPFHGAHQAGIVTAVQDRMHFVALDVTTTDRGKLAELLRQWTAAAERMTTGAEVVDNGAVGGNPQAPPADNGEALGLGPSRLTLTFGLGPSLFDGRFGLAAAKPAALAPLPPFPGDALEPARSGGDLCIQACADDPQVAVHAIRHLVRMGFGAVAVRWAQLGFGRTSSTTAAQDTPRNLFGFKDGTNNIKAEDADLLRDHVWVQPGDGPDWLAGGTYLVTRRIRMHIEIWDRTSLAEQQTIVGRAKGTGAPLTGTAEFAAADFDAKGSDGELVIPAAAHIRLASSATLNGVKILRRGFNFTDGADGQGHLDAGLFFVGFMRDAHKQFVPMQMALASKDVMMEYIKHNGSALFAVPPGVRHGGHWADTLLGG